MNTKLKDMEIVLFMDFYEILEVDQYASPIEIKKSYRRLARLYHPDKNENNEIKMKDINLAYEVLSDNKLKENYDRTIEYNEEPYDLIQNIIKKNKLDILNHLFNFIYDDENKLKNDINEMNFVNMLKTVKDKVNLDINSKIDISLKDIYENNNITLVVKRNIHGILKDFEIKINLDIYDEELNYEGLGDQYYFVKGNLIINTNLSYDESKYCILDNYNFQINSDTLDFKLFDKIDVNILEKKEIFSNNNFKVYEIKNYGFYDDNKKKRGDLYIKINL